VNRVCAFIGLGSNLNDPERQLRRACRELESLPHSRGRGCSSLYRSRPLGPQNQPDFVNAVVELSTALAPQQLLRQLQRIESSHGRVRSGERWGPRPLDLDLLLFGERIIRTPSLTVPHPGLTERAFVLYPLLEVAGPALQIPGRGPLGPLVAACDRGGLRKLARATGELQ